MAYVIVEPCIGTKHNSCVDRGGDAGVQAAPEQAR